MKKVTNRKKAIPVGKLIPGKLCKCYYCDVDNNCCKKYEKTKWDLGEYTWENYCLKDGGCNR